MSSLPSKIIVLLKKIANAEGLIDFDIIIGSNTNKKDNFLGELVSVVVTGKQIGANGTKIEKKLDLLCKFAPVNSLKVGLKTESFFEREIFFYKTVAPAFSRFQEEKKLTADEQFKSFPRCYDAVYDPDNGICVIVMQNLRPEGYEMWPNEQPMPIERMRLIVQELAKFHAISFAMKDQRPDQFEEFKKLQDLAADFMNVPHIESTNRQTIQRAMNAMDCEVCKNIMRECLQNYSRISTNCLLEKFSDQSCVLTHGDCWKNNIIYRTAVSSRWT